MKARRDPAFLLFARRPDEYSAKGLWLLVALYFGSLLAAAIISPLAFRLVHHLDPQADWYIASKPFPEYFDRARLLFVVLLFPYLFVKCQLASARRIGFHAFHPAFARWFLYGIGMMAVVYGFQFAWGAIEPRQEWTAALQLKRCAAALAGAFLIGLIEETLFRGLVFRIFYTALRPVIAVLLSSAFFAYLHFKMPDIAMDHVAVEAIGIDDGLAAAWKTLTAFTYGFDPLLFLNLTLVGVVLHQCFLLKGNLWSCIGLHAGWVFVILSLSKTFGHTERANWFTGTERVANGLWVTCVLLFVVAAFALILSRRNRP